MRIPGPPPKDWRLIAPAAVKLLGYPKATSGRAGGTPAPQADGDTKWFVQPTAGDFHYAVVAEMRRQDNVTLLAVTIAAGAAERDVVAEGRRLVARALDTGYSKMLGPHEAWWRDFWHASRIELPELDLWRHYCLVQYFYGAASRRGAPPIPLQGVWTADNGELPPWKGDYHHDLNTQTTYIAYQTAGRFDEGLCFLEFLWKLLPEFRRFAKQFYDAPGAAVPARDDARRPAAGRLGRCTRYSRPMPPGSDSSSTNTGVIRWTRHSYASGRIRGAPRSGNACSTCSSPTPTACSSCRLAPRPKSTTTHFRRGCEPNSNYDHDCMAALFGGLAEMADALGKPERRGPVAGCAGGLGQRAVDPQTPA